jgi:hypothetical protein
MNETGQLYFLIGFNESTNIHFIVKKAIYRSIIDFLDKFYYTAQYRIIPIDEALK